MADKRYLLADDLTQDDLRKTVGVAMLMVVGLDARAILDDRVRESLMPEVGYLISLGRSLSGGVVIELASHLDQDDLVEDYWSMTHVVDREHACVVVDG